MGWLTTRAVAAASASSAALALLACNALSGASGLVADEATDAGPGASASGGGSSGASSTSSSGSSGASSSGASGSSGSSGSASGGVDAGRQPPPGGSFVFVTSTTMTGQLTADGGAGTGGGPFAGPDGLCKSLAAAAGLAPTRWVAWLSDNMDDAVDRFDTAGPYYLVTGPQVLPVGGIYGSPGTLEHAIDTTETGVTLASPAPVWTGTDEDGLGGAPSCSTWNTTSGSGQIGEATAVDRKWTTEGAQPCSIAAHLYCFQN